MRASIDGARASEVRSAVDHVNREGDANLMQRAPQPAARCLRVGLGPQQARHVVAANRRARIRQIRDEAQAFAQGKVDAAPVEAQGREIREAEPPGESSRTLDPARACRGRTGDARILDRASIALSCANDIGASNDIPPPGDKGWDRFFAMRSRRADRTAALHFRIERRRRPVVNHLARTTCPRPRPSGLWAQAPWLRGAASGGCRTGIVEALLDVADHASVGHSYGGTVGCAPRGASRGRLPVSPWSQSPLTCAACGWPTAARDAALAERHLRSSARAGCGSRRGLREYWTGPKAWQQMPDTARDMPSAQRQVAADWQFMFAAEDDRDAIARIGAPTLLSAAGALAAGMARGRGSPPMPCPTPCTTRLPTPVT